MKKISLVIPFFNEEKNLQPLWQKIVSVMRTLQDSYSWELILIDDGSSDRSSEVVEEIANADDHVSLIVFRRNFGKAAGLSAGFSHATGEIIITLDADLQDDPCEIPRFLEKIEEGYDLVVGWKKKRHDPGFFVIFSRLANWLIRRSVKLKIHDLNCGFKAYTRELAGSLNLYGEQFRFIPVFASNMGFKVYEIPVVHHKRMHGRSKYKAGKAFRGLMDFFTIMFSSNFGYRPMHFFGGAGFVTFFIGFIVALYLTIEKIFYGITLFNRPLLLLAVLLIIFGVQLISVGLLGEILLARTLKADTTYQIKKIIKR